MSKSAMDVMQQIIFGAVVDAISALRVDSNGVPNIFLRELGTINANATFADLPEAVRQAIKGSTSSGFKLMHKEGYAIGLRSEAIRQPARANTPQQRRRKPSTA